jgi:chaperonin GroES
LLVRRHEAESVTEGGIVIPEASRNQPQQGIVLAVGPDVTSLHEGDEILFQNLGVTEVEIAGETVLLMDEEDAMIVLREKTDDS